jgi:hypothetical protein
MQTQANWFVTMTDGKDERVKAGHVTLQTDGSLVFGNLVTKAGQGPSLDAHTLINARAWTKAKRSSIEAPNGGLTQ